MQVRIAGFEIEAEIGRGGFGVVYRARQTDFGRLAAVKVLLPGATAAELQRRFAQECRAVGALRPHPNIVTVYSTGTTDDGTPYLAMQYLGGGSLAARVPLSAGATAALGARLADGLGVAHAGGVIHRDVKPANILFDDDSEPVLVDFGISALTGDGSTTASDVALSVAYAPPEVLRGDRAAAAVDVYSLGATLFAAVTGRTPFADPEGTTPIARLATRILHDPVEDLRPAGVPDALCAVIERCLAKEPAQRYTSMAEVRAALLPIEGDAVSASPAELWAMPTALRSAGELDPDRTSLRAASRPAPPARRRRLVVAAVAAVLVGGGITAAVAATGGPDDAPAGRGVAGTSARTGSVTPGGNPARSAGGVAAGRTPVAGTEVPIAQRSVGLDGPAGTTARAVPPAAGATAGARPGRTAPGATTTRTVRVPPPDRAPVLGTVPALTAGEGRAVDSRVTATDPDGDPLRFSVTGLPRGLRATAGGAITGTIAATASAATASYRTIRSQRFTLTVTAVDPAGKRATAKRVWTIKDTRFVMPDYRGYRGCDGTNGCREPVRNFRELGPHTTACRVAANGRGLIVAQSLRPGASAAYGRKLTFTYSRKSC